jgi:hypothetical protein
MPNHDTTFVALVSEQRQGAREAKLCDGLDEVAAFLLPLAFALARLTALRHAAQMAA